MLTMLDQRIEMKIRMFQRRPVGIFWGMIIIMFSASSVGLLQSLMMHQHKGWTCPKL